MVIFYSCGKAQKQKNPKKLTQDEIKRRLTEFLVMSDRIESE